MSSYKYCNLFSDKTLGEFSEDSLSFIIEEELYLCLTNLIESYSCHLKILIIQDFSICSLCWSPYTWSLINKYI